MPDETRYELVITGDAEVTKAADIAAAQAEEAEASNEKDG
jgi:hypothetical protein